MGNKVWDKGMSDDALGDASKVIDHPVCESCRKLKKCPVKRNIKKFYCADHSEIING